MSRFTIYGEGVVSMQYVIAFVFGGILCVIAQILIDKTKITPAKILVIYVVSGVILTAVGVYAPLVNFAGAGATVPLTGFGYALAEGVREEVTMRGFVGIFTGGLSACASGISAAILFSFIFSLFKKPETK